jgi:multisubunit Na+/H+ antiporter MnhE subunit
VDDPDPRESRPRQRLRVVTDLLVGAGLWLLMAGSLHAQELAAALVVGGVTAVAGSRVRRHVGHQDTGALLWLRHLPGWYVKGLWDTAPLTRALVSRVRGRPSRSRLLPVPFEVGGLGPTDSSRRALVALGLCLQPNTYVVGFDRDRGVVLVHQLEPENDEPVPARLRVAR